MSSKLFFHVQEGSGNAKRLATLFFFSLRDDEIDLFKAAILLMTQRRVVKRGSQMNHSSCG
jgi:hypothetical protein